MNNKRGKLEISFLMDNGIIEQSKSAIYLTLKGVPMVILHDFEALFSYARYYFPVVNRGSRPSMEYHTRTDLLRQQKGVKALHSLKTIAKSFDHQEAVLISQVSDDQRELDMLQKFLKPGLNFSC